MKIGEMLLKLGKKLTEGENEVKNESNISKNTNVKEVNLLASKEDDEGWSCWWIFNKPAMPKIFKDDTEDIQ